MTARVSDILPAAAPHASRPAAPNTVPALFSCSDHRIIYRWDGTAWSDWATLGDSPAVRDEAIRDVMGAALVAGSNVTITPNDAGDTITVSATDTNTTDPEVVRDTIAAALVAGTNVTITPNDAGDTITITASAPTTRALNTPTANYTLALGDAGAFVRMNVATANTLTVPPNSAVAFPIGTFVEGSQAGAGQTTITPGAGVTINASPGLKTASQYSTFGLLKVATDTWLAYGRLSA